MELMQAILTRRSIRSFERDKPVPKEMIRTLLQAAMRAPSARNQQTWCFVVIEDREILDTIPTFSPNSKMCESAPMAIVVCGDLKRESQQEGFWIQDCSAAIQNILLTAHSLGLGAVWTAVHPKSNHVSNAQKLFSLPAHIVPLAIVPVGWPAEKVDPVDTFDPKRIYLNCWGDEYPF